MQSIHFNPDLIAKYLMNLIAPSKKCMHWPHIFVTMNYLYFFHHAEETEHDSFEKMYDACGYFYYVDKFSIATSEMR